MREDGYYMSNPYLPEWEYIPDGEPHVFGGRLYIFGSHDRFAGEKFCMEDYVGWSAPIDDLNDWRCDGVIYKKTQHPGNEDGRLAMYAPDVTQGPDGRYYLYYSLADDIEMGVAVSDEPTGKYEFLGIVHHSNGVNWGSAEGDILPFDPGVINHNGKVYLYAGQGPMNKVHGMFSKRTRRTAYVVEMEEDMVTMKTEPKEFLPTIWNSKGTGFEGHEFFEANSIRKFGDKFYFIYSSVKSQELVYAYSDKPDEGFKFGGILTSNGDVGLNGNKKNLYYVGNNHGSVECIKGKYYIFGHRHTNRSMYSRQGYADPIEMTADGQFVQAPRTSNGFDEKIASGFRACKASHLYSKKGACFSIGFAQGKSHPYITQENGIKLEDNEESVNANSESYQYIANMKDGAVAGFRYVDLSETDEMSLVVRGNGDGEMVIFDMENYMEIGRAKVMPNPEWYTVKAAITKKDSKIWLGFKYKGKGSIDFNEFS